MDKLLKWLPQFNILHQKVFFLGEVDMTISVSSETEALVKEKDIFSTEQLGEAENKSTILKLLNAGVIVPFDGCLPRESSESQEKILVIQPHCDDFALSCGGTLAKQCIADKRKIIFVTVFSKYSSQSFPWKDKIHLNDDEYSKLRRQEDTIAADYLRGSTHTLEYRDSIARGAGLSVILREGILKKDNEMIEAITEDLGALVKEYKPQMIVLPAAFGWHYDHRITLTAALRSLKKWTGYKNVYLNEDYPYCDQNRHNYWGRLKELKKEFDMKPVYTDIKSYIKTKAYLINFYRTQFIDWNLKGINKSITELAEATAIEAMYLKHGIDNQITMAERIWEISFGGGQL